MRGQSGRGESGFRGVARKAGTKQWRAQIQLHLGTYSSESAAAEMYVRAERLFRQQAQRLRQEYGDLRES